MSVLIAASAIRTCFGDGASTFEALLAGRCGVRQLQYIDAERVNVACAYQPPRDSSEEPMFIASTLLAECVREAVEHAQIGPQTGRVVAIVGTGLGELRAVERMVVQGARFRAEQLHFAEVVREACPQVERVITLSNACSAGAHALALAQDVLETGEADAVIAAATDSLTESMVAMIGRFATARTQRVSPFDVHRGGALLGEGAAAIVLTPEHRTTAALARLLSTGLSCDACNATEALARLLSTGLSCDAHHPTVPSLEGIQRAIQNALARTGRRQARVDLVVAHGTGTQLNDPLEARVIGATYAAEGPAPLVTAVKGATGHTSGSAALVSTDVALRAMRAGLVPPIAGLEEPIREAESLHLVRGAPVAADLGLVAINAFGFGGVNAVIVLERIP